MSKRNPVASSSKQSGLVFANPDLDDPGPSRNFDTDVPMGDYTPIPTTSRTGAFGDNTAIVTAINGVIAHIPTTYRVEL
jgi:hypothetical protein